MSSKRYPNPFTLLLVAAVLLPAGVLSSGGSLAGQAGTAAAQPPSTASGGPLFIANAGQWPDAARFQVWGGGQAVWLAEDALWLTVSEERESGGVGERENFTHSPSLPLTTAPQQGVNLRLSFPGANPHPVLEPFDRLDTHVSYFLGNDPAAWRPDVPVWGGVRYRDLYPGVDLAVGAADGRWQWRLVPSSVAAGGPHPPAPSPVPTGEGVSPSPAAAGEGRGGGLTLRIEGADAVALDGATLRLSTAAGEVALPLLTAERSNVQRANVERLNAQAFDVTVPFAQTRTSSQSAIYNLQTTDLLYSIFLGSGNDYGHAIAVDAAGSAYVTGWTGSSDFPTTSGAFDTSYNGRGDAFVVKLNPAGSALAYATFLGGGGHDGGNGIAVDRAGSAYVTGSTYSGDFPTTPGAFDTSFNGGYPSDAFVVKLSPTGGALAYATFIGGGAPDYGSAIAVDGTGRAYVTGDTSSSDFPTTPGAFDTSYNGPPYANAFVAKLDSTGSELSYATFLGGTGNDYGFAIAVDETGSAYVTGEAESSDFPITPGAFDPSYNGGYGDAFAVKLDPTGSALAYATFLGGSTLDYGLAIAVDGAGRAYVTGPTKSSDFPTTPGAFDTSYNGDTSSYCGDAFIVKLNPAGSVLVYATFLGGSSWEYGSAIAVDGAGRAYVTGPTTSSDFPTTPGAFDPSYNGRVSNVFVAKLDPTGSALAYATFLGGGNTQEGHAVTVDGAGRAYVTGDTSASDFPVTPGAFDTSHNGHWDAFVVKLSTTYLPAIQGTVWHDLDGDATRDAGEPGLAGVQVCAEPLGHRAVRCATSGSDGSYAIELDMPGTYLVTPSGAPAGMRLTTPGFRLPVVVREGQQVWNVDCGYR